MLVQFADAISNPSVARISERVVCGKLLNSTMVAARDVGPSFDSALQQSWRRPGLVTQ
jgi:hypothetical protein